MERRLVAIFAADVAGYARLMGRDEVGTMEALTAHRQVMDDLIVRHRGRIANTAGDSVLAEFPSAVDAVQCALAAQAALAAESEGLPDERRLRFRIGVHVGDVLVEDGDLFGDGVNTAARLQALSEPGGVCVSGLAQEHVRKALPLAFQDLGLQTLKNIAEPIRAYAVKARPPEDAMAAPAAEIPGDASRPPPGAQNAGRLRRIGVLLAATADDPEYPALVDAFLDRLRQLGWSRGDNLSIDVRWSGAGAEAVRKHAAELAALAPDAILAPGSAAAGPLLQATRSVPVVFTVVPDPVGAGFVDSLERPGGNATGLASFDYSLGGKWLETLKEIAPGVRRVGVLRDPAVTAGIGQWSAIQAAAPRFGVEASPINLRDAPDLARDVAAFAAPGKGAAPRDGGLVVTSSALTVRHRALIVRTAAEHGLPAVYYAKAFVPGGGLVSYGSDRADQFRRAAGYVDRILNGESPADLPVTAPANYELAVNLKTAKALGLTVPKSLLARADEVYE
jgi:putative ABC transport system substrate-binding protein